MPLANMRNRTPITLLLPHNEKMLRSRPAWTKPAHQSFSAQKEGTRALQRLPTRAVKMTHLQGDPSAPLVLPSYAAQERHRLLQQVPQQLSCYQHFHLHPLEKLL